MINLRAEVCNRDLLAPATCLINTLVQAQHGQTSLSMDIMDIKESILHVRGNQCDSHDQALELEAELELSRAQSADLQRQCSTLAADLSDVDDILKVTIGHTARMPTTKPITPSRPHWTATFRSQL